MKKTLFFLSTLLITCLAFSQSSTQWLFNPDLQGKRIGLVCNHTSFVDSIHRIDYLLQNNYNLLAVFTPEHGLTGLAEAGEKVNDSTIRDGKIIVRSLYGKTKKPKKEWLNDIDIMLFDLQDVGCRFYTYISTLEYVMQACIESNIPLIVYDRPNPNNFVDGPVLEPKYRSFVGMQPIPVCYGLTIGEYAMMINQEHWVDKDQMCNLLVVPMKNYNRDEQNPLPIAPSPNLQTLQAIINYPTLCFFEGTPFSVGRGTPTPFETVFLEAEKTKTKLCFNKIKLASKKIELAFILKVYKESNLKEKFFNSFFDKLAGTDQLRKQILEGKSEEQIRESWEADIEKYLQIRDKYLIYF